MSWRYTWTAWGYYLASLFKCYLYGTADGSRTRNPRNGSPMLYRLSYSGMLYDEKKESEHTG